MCMKTKVNVHMHTYSVLFFLLCFGTSGISWPSRREISENAEGKPCLWNVSKCEIQKRNLNDIIFQNGICKVCSLQNVHVTEHVLKYIFFTGATWAIQGETEHCTQPSDDSIFLFYYLIELWSCELVCVCCGGSNPQHWHEPMQSPPTLLLQGVTDASLGKFSSSPEQWQ